MTDKFIGLPSLESIDEAKHKQLILESVKKIGTVTPINFPTSNYVPPEFHVKITKRIQGAIFILSRHFSNYKDLITFLKNNKYDFLKDYKHTEKEII